MVGPVTSVKTTFVALQLSVGTEVGIVKHKTNNFSYRQNKMKRNLVENNTNHFSFVKDSTKSSAAYENICIFVTV